MERVDASRTGNSRKRVTGESSDHRAVFRRGFFPLLVAGSTLFPSCLVTFRDWPEEDRARETSTTAGGNATTIRATSDHSRTALATTSAGAVSATATAQGGVPSSSQTSGTATGATPVAGGAMGITASTSLSPNGGGSNGGAPGSGISGGASSGGTSSGGAFVSGSSGGAASSGAASGGNSASGGSTLTTGSIAGETIRWLTFTGTRADGTDPVNASVGINGEVRVDSDACTNVTFDPVTRCVTGTLCTYSFDNQYWGAALVFDFVNTQGLRYRWDPDAVRALGVAYRLHGTQIPKLQLWVLDMDSSLWPTSCSGTSCEIIGPPYGDDNIGPSGALHFDAMVHDDWDGTGIAYQHLPENTLSLQFKIPAVIAGSVPFDFCLDQLGVIVRTP